MEGITTSDSHISATPILIMGERGRLNIQGTFEGTQISVYDLGGVKVGAAVSSNGTTEVLTSLKPGDVAIVKIGEKTIKVMMK